MTVSDRKFCCPVCAHQTEVAPADASERRSHGLFDKLYSYRVCRGCSLLFRVSLLDKALKHFSSNQVSTLAIPVSNDSQTYNEEWSIEQVDMHSNIRPAPSEGEVTAAPQEAKTPDTNSQAQPAAHTNSPAPIETAEVTSGVGIQLQINQTRVKVQFDLPIGEAVGSTKVQNDIQTAISTLGQAIAALGTMQQQVAGVPAAHTPPVSAVKSVSASTKESELVSEPFELFQPKD